MLQKLNIRSDPAGDGRFGASRDGGTREHVGIDYACVPGGQVLSTVDGVVSKHGWAYKGDSKWRYVEVTDHEGLRHRFFYVTPVVAVDVDVVRGQPIGIAQNITERYRNSKMLPHVHYEIKDSQGNYQDPGHYGATGSIA